MRDAHGTVEVANAIRDVLKRQTWIFGLYCQFVFCIPGHSARLILMPGVNELDSFAASRTPMPLVRQSLLRAEQSLINELVREAVDTLITIMGNGVLTEGSDIDIGWRDINVMTRHANVATNIA